MGATERKRGAQEQESRYTDEQIIGFFPRRLMPAYVRPSCAARRLQQRHVVQVAGEVRWDGGQRRQAAARVGSREHENTRLKKLLAEAALDNGALTVAFGLKR
jgi:putative transposase